MSLPSIPGTPITNHSRQQELQNEVAKLLELDSNPRRFPGAQPISFAKCHIDELINENYFVSEKADGIRCLLFTRVSNREVESYLIDRKNTFYLLNFGLPMPGLKRPHRATILDGELVFEQRKGSEIWFLLFDALVVDGKSLTKKEYTSRLGYLRRDVIEPYLKSCEQPGYASRFPFKLRQKRIEFSYNLETVFQHMKQYKHKTDGLIFTSASAPYTSGTTQTMLKWKPSNENTVDFKVRQVNDDYELGVVVERGKYKSCGRLKGDNKEDLDGRVIECRWEDNGWYFARFRDDKEDANHISTYEKILESIEDNVTDLELIEAVPDIYDVWKRRDPNIKARVVI